MTERDNGAAFARYWRGFRQRTRRLLPLVPADRIEWRAGPGRWSLGDLFRHLATVERWMYAENALGRPSRYPGHGPALAEGAETIGQLMDRLHAGALAIFEALTPEQMAAKTRTPAGSEITTSKWLRAMTEHEAHHRGQIYLMLGLLGVETPPLFGLTEEEVLRRSS